MSGDAEVNDVEREVTPVYKLRPWNEQVDVVVKVLDNKESINRTRLKVAECLVADQTAAIVVTVRNEHIEQMKKDSVVKISGAKVEVYQHIMRLFVPKSSKITNMPDGTIKKVKTDFNMSSLDFELVKVDVKNTNPQPQAEANGVSQPANDDGFQQADAPETIQ